MNVIKVAPRGYFKEMLVKMKKLVASPSFGKMFMVMTPMTIKHVSVVYVTLNRDWLLRGRKGVSEASRCMTFEQINGSPGRMPLNTYLVRMNGIKEKELLMMAQTQHIF